MYITYFEINSAKWSNHQKSHRGRIMNKIILTLILLSVSSWVSAQQPLNKETVESFIRLNTEMIKLESKYPEVFERADSYEFSEDSKGISYLKSSVAYPDIKRALSVSNFKSLGEYIRVTSRIMGAMVAVQMEKMPAGMGMGDLGSMMDISIQTMKQNGVSAEVIAEMKQNMEQQNADMKGMKIAAKNASSQDKKFVRENMDWLMSIMPDENQ